jgi:hypothetical protein
MTSSIIVTALNTGYSPLEWSHIVFDVDLTMPSQSDELTGFLRLRKLVPLNCNGSEQLEIRICN